MQAMYDDIILYNLATIYKAVCPFVFFHMVIMFGGDNVW